ncbi:hypothetical protein Hanom_Chr13g01200461 [Helianthus anomalus]
MAWQLWRMAGYRLQPLLQPWWLGPFAFSEPHELLNVVWRRGSCGGWQVIACNPYCSHGGLVLLHSLSLMSIYSPNAYRQFVWEFINDPAIFRLLPNFASFCWRGQLF